ncbi:hypothetical protein Q1695_000594 [Nippostrongylus brasiliensis]|nr:hypothetical protein Q1695_000594 [Nippostrongylus brasiliensis]
MLFTLNETRLNTITGASGPDTIGPPRWRVAFDLLLILVSRSFTVSWWATVFIASIMLSHKRVYVTRSSSADEKVMSPKQSDSVSKATSVDEKVSSSQKRVYVTRASSVGEKVMSSKQSDSVSKATSVDEKVTSSEKRVCVSRASSVGGKVTSSQKRVSVVRARSVGEKVTSSQKSVSVSKASSVGGEVASSQKSVTVSEATAVDGKVTSSQKRVPVSRARSVGGKVTSSQKRVTVVRARSVGEKSKHPYPDPVNWEEVKRQRIERRKSMVPPRKEDYSEEGCARRRRRILGGCHMIASLVEKQKAAAQEGVIRPTGFTLCPPGTLPEDHMRKLNRLHVNYGKVVDPNEIISRLEERSEKVKQMRLMDSTQSCALQVNRQRPPTPHPVIRVAVREPAVPAGSRIVQSRMPIHTFIPPLKQSNNLPPIRRVYPASQSSTAVPAGPNMAQSKVPIRCAPQRRIKFLPSKRWLYPGSRPLFAMPGGPKMVLSKMPIHTFPPQIKPNGWLYPVSCTFVTPRAEPTMVQSKMPAHTFTTWTRNKNLPSNCRFYPVSHSVAALGGNNMVAQPLLLPSRRIFHNPPVNQIKKRTPEDEFAHWYNFPIDEFPPSEEQEENRPSEQKQAAKQEEVPNEKQVPPECKEEEKTDRSFEEMAVEQNDDCNKPDKDDDCDEDRLVIVESKENDDENAKKINPAAHITKIRIETHHSTASDVEEMDDLTCENAKEQIQSIPSNESLHLSEVENGDGCKAAMEQNGIDQKVSNNSTDTECNEAPKLMEKESM